MIDEILVAVKSDRASTVGLANFLKKINAIKDGSVKSPETNAGTKTKRLPGAEKL